MKTNLFQLAQAKAEGWTLAVTDGLVSIVSADRLKNDLTARSHVFNQIMAGSAYHIRAFQIVTAQDAGAIARVPDVANGDFVKLTETITAPVTKTVVTPAVTRNEHMGDGEYRDVEVSPETSEEVTTDVTKPAGTLATVTGRGFGLEKEAQFTITFSDGGEVTFTETDDVWFPFVKIETFVVGGNYGLLTVDKQTGAVLDYRPAEGEEPEYADITLIDVVELRSTLEILPDVIDFSLVGFTTKSGERERADRRAWIDVRLDDPEEVDPVLARFIRAELKKLG